MFYGTRDTTCTLNPEFMANAYETPVEIDLADKSAEYTEKVKANELNPIVSVYESLLSLGTNSILEKTQKKYIRICNFIAINTFAASLVYLILAILWEKWYWFNSILALTITCVCVLFLNGFNKTSMSRLTYMLGINALVLLNALFIGPEAKGESFFIIAIIIPFLIYDIKEIGFIASGIIIPLVFIFAYAFVTPFFTAYNLGHEQQILLYRIGIVIQVLLSLGAVYQFVYYSKKAENDLDTSNQQMSLQTNELKRSNSDLEQFAYIISHDLKAPVRNISSFMNLLVNKHGAGLNPEAREFVEYSRSGAKRMERLIDDVLAYCRIGTNLSKPTPVNLNDVVNTIRFELHDKLTAAHGTVAINKELPVISNVHSSLMYHVFQNLITNGLKFNKTDAPEITVSWTNSLNYYTFSVRDNGIGISKEYSATIFQMFKRLHNESEYDGTGIGLAICKKIVEYYHGEIWFESEAGKGTTFHFTIRKF
ncbi:MAG: Solute:Sodium Symporter [Bacteroidota bacterium]|nr:Solute:Sodium Symporter [Bacteroidota bacterium]